MKIAISQMRSDPDFDRNLGDMITAVKLAADGGASFCFFPEMALLLDRNRKRAIERVTFEAENPYVKMLAVAARDMHMWVHIGSLPVKSEVVSGKFANRSLVINDHGEIVARYDKIHLFDVALSSGESWRESDQYVAGEKPVLVHTPLGHLGLTICYDLRFSPLYSALAQAGAEVFIVPAAFTVPTGKAHWHTLLRARAIESAAFVIAPAQSGHHADGRDTFGHSLVIDPWGEVLLDMGEGEGVGFAEINLAKVAEARQQVPVIENARSIGTVQKM